MGFFPPKKKYPSEKIDMFRFSWNQRKLTFLQWAVWPADAIGSPFGTGDFLCPSGRPSGLCIIDSWKRWKILYYPPSSPPPPPPPYSTYCTQFKKCLPPGPQSLPRPQSYRDSIDITKVEQILHQVDRYDYVLIENPNRNHFPLFLHDRPSLGAWSENCNTSLIISEMLFLLKQERFILFLFFGNDRYENLLGRPRDWGFSTFKQSIVMPHGRKLFRNCNDFIVRMTMSWWLVTGVQSRAQSARPLSSFDFRISCFILFFSYYDPGKGLYWKECMKLAFAGSRLLNSVCIFDLDGFTSTLETWNFPQKCGELRIFSVIEITSIRWLL